MTCEIPFSAQKPQASSQLPLTLISLDDWSLVTVKGPDRVKYLQGQITVDVAAVTAEQHVIAAHCDAKGKMWSNLRLLHRGEGLAFIERRSVLNNQLEELKKYAIFSKVTLAADKDAKLLGVAGLAAREALADVFSELPTVEHPVVQQDMTTILHFTQPTERFLLVTDTIQKQQLVAKLGTTTQFNDSQQWLALDIEAGFPLIDAETSALFIPQATNIQALGGISFTKGCYTGQEMVTRAKYRGANKRALYWLAGNANRVPIAGENLEWQLGSHWRRTGSVLSAIQLSDDTLWVQAVLNNDLTEDTVLRVRDDSSSMLKVRTLPYSLREGE
ncbi:tRNA-modifying protein YgfZ [Candidatus Fukatsuia symbiotica]|uniref:tRNA-modifying protein YgfZ n=1 Tax=Candidatus Fukatsuia symbiotica TaxID=1878942 RepID=A0A2U8I4H0_9GAMM|nr:tRNA-modifying protein YgfZ [Candidatus Fukatsuia symbiotica]AWK14032.1 tRNA-modifying protein YgfZ [Candidatus Fukatsuia symbiotica]MEA9445613.1 tRNA-modifying protein YgfZ [Candidatus Fukatsuia symbiotica]